MLKKVVSSLLITALSSTAMAGSFGAFDVSLTGGLASLGWDDASYFLSSTRAAGGYTYSFSAQLSYTTEQKFFFSNEISAAFYRDITIYNDALTVGYYFNPAKYVYIAPFVGVGIVAMNLNTNLANGSALGTSLGNVGYKNAATADYTLPIGVTLTVPVHEKVYLSAKFNHSLSELSKSNVANYVNYGFGVTYKCDADKMVDSITLAGAYFNKDTSALATATGKPMYLGGYAAALTVTF